MSVLLRRALNGICWGIIPPRPPEDPVTIANRTAILAATL